MWDDAQLLYAEGHPARQPFRTLLFCLGIHKLVSSLLSDPSWLQATLPVGTGGLGIAVLPVISVIIIILMMIMIMIIKVTNSIQ